MVFPQFKFNPRLALTASQMRQLDQTAEAFNLQILQMMELAAFQMARLIRQTQKIDNQTILILAGKGNNGADAIASARFLANWNAKPMIITPKSTNPHSQHHLHLAKQLKIPIHSSLQLIKQPAIIIDGLLGYSIKGLVRQPYQDWINYINQANLPVYSLDIPSGLDPDTGKPHGLAVKATYTLTLAYPKKGLFKKPAQPYIGQLYLADIGIPKAVYQQLKLNYKNLFTQSSIIKLT
jgi:NAD(P)H-hydrate epimerase